MKKLLEIGKVLTVTVFGVLFLFILTEGLLSILLLAGDVADEVGEGLADSGYTRFDANLGWSSTPGALVDDMYADGIGVSINSQGFRGTKEYTKEVPQGRVRAICSGDSFTFGYGVNDSETWCEELARLDHRIEPVNMGQSGYGIGQAYLWYNQDSHILDHDILIFAFITDDFRRLTQKKFLNYSKPVVVLEENRLAVENTPVPSFSFNFNFITKNIQSIMQLRTLQFIRSIRGSNLDVEEDAKMSFKDYVPTAVKIIEELKDKSRREGRAMMVVYMPSEEDYRTNATKGLRDYLSKRLSSTGIDFLDLVGEFDKMPLPASKKVFIQEGVLKNKGGEGHLTVLGNRYVGQYIYNSLKEVPEVKDMLSQRAGN